MHANLLEEDDKKNPPLTEQELSYLRIGGNTFSIIDCLARKAWKNAKGIGQEQSIGQGIRHKSVGTEPADPEAKLAALVEKHGTPFTDSDDNDVTFHKKGRLIK